MVQRTGGCGAEAGRRRIRWRPNGLIALIAAAGLALPACGDDDGDVADTAATEAPEAEAPETEAPEAETPTAEAPSPAEDVSADWTAALESSIEEGLNEQWAGQYENHAVTCPTIDLETLDAGTSFTCVADCECVPPRVSGTGSDIVVTYEGDGTAYWEEVLAPGASGPGPDGGPASGTFSG